MTKDTKQFTNMDIKTITKNIKKITSNKLIKSRPILQKMYLNNNTIIATDGFRLININYEHNESNQLINPKTNEVFERENEYPNADRIIPLTENATNVIKINSNEIDLIISVLKAYKHLKIYNTYLILNSDKEYYTLDISTTEKQENEYMGFLNLNYKLLNNNIGDNNGVNKLILNVEYLLSAMEFLKDYDKVTNNITEYLIYIEDKFRPIKITSEKNDFDYVICPVRLH